MSAARLIGSSVERVEDPRFLTGAARFVADTWPARCLHAVFVRSPHARAAITGCHTAAAAAAPGVVAVLTAGDLALVLGDLAAVRAPGLLAPDVAALARGGVRYVGDPVAIVVASSPARAQDAAALVDVTYEPLPAVVDVDAALAPGAPILWPALGTNVMHHQAHVIGDIGGALAGADLIVRERFHQHRFANAPMECRGGLAEFDAATGTLTYTTGHQSPHDLRLRLASTLRLPAHRVRVRCTDMGGSFGQKSGLAREDAVVAATAVLLRRPVRWIEERTENLQSAGHAREERADVEAGFTAGGHLLGLRVHLVLDLGAYPQIGYPASGYANLIRALLPAAYRVPAYEFVADLVATDKATYVPFRGPWEMETFVRERLFDVAARRLGIDRVELRRHNLLDDAELDEGSCTGVVLRGVRARQCLDTAAALADERGWHERQRAARAEGRLVGIGMAGYVEPAPVSPSLLAAMGLVAAPRTTQEARLRLEPDGTLTVYTSQQPHGQGHETTLAQLAADRLRLPIERVRVVWGDTDVVPYNLVGTGGSRAAMLASGAVLTAADALAAKLRAFAAEVLECDAADLELSDGTVTPRDAPTRAQPIASLAAAAFARPGSASGDGTPGIEARGVYLSDDGTWSVATHACLVEVDVETANTRILDYVVVEDCGPSINPAIVDGQIRGGVAQGIGAVLFERIDYDGDGQLRTASLVDYLVASAAEIPPIAIHHLHGALDVTDDDPVPFRGVGEGGAIGAPSTVVSAIEDAVGVVLTEQHLPPMVLAARCGIVPASES